MNRLKRIWRAFFSIPVLLSTVGLSCLLLAVGFAAMGWLAADEPAGIPTAGLTVIAGPTSTIYAPTATATRVPTESSDLPPAPLAGMIGLGSTVQIFGTDGSGLNIREQAGLNSPVRFVALDSEVFEVRAGPEVLNEITWWYLVTSLDEERSGWAAANYLSLVADEEN